MNKGIIAVVAVATLWSMTIRARGAEVHSRSGVHVQVSEKARHRLQCVIDYLEIHGVRVRYMRGYGKGTVPHSKHPSGDALDVNQTSRNSAPGISTSLANAAGNACGVTSGGTWRHRPDKGHWNL